MVIVKFINMRTDKVNIIIFKIINQFMRNIGKFL